MKVEQYEKDTPFSTDLVPSPKERSLYRDLRSSGLLGEINRRVLHPFGLALFVQVEDDDDRTPLRLGLIETKDEEGIRFAEERFPQVRELLRAYIEGEGGRKLLQRKNLLGYYVQGEEEDKKRNSDDLTHFLASSLWSGYGRLLDRVTEALRDFGADDLAADCAHERKMMDDYLRICDDEARKKQGSLQAIADGRSVCEWCGKGNEG